MVEHGTSAGGRALLLLLYHRTPVIALFRGTFLAVVNDACYVALHQPGASRDIRRDNTVPRYACKAMLEMAMSAVAVLAMAGAAGAVFPDRPIEGFGSETTGGLGGTPYVVTSLADDGPGTLRDAVSQSNRYVTFDVGGTIELDATLRITGDHITIDATEAPAPGITITAAHAGVTAALLDLRGASHMIIRNIRVIDAPDVDTGDNLRIWEYAHHIVIDHCSFRRAGDGNIDIVRDAHDITIQWCILADTVKNSLIAERCYSISLHHNLYVGGDERNPQVDNTTFVDFVNNVVFGWAGNYGTRIRNAASANVVMNYYIPDDGSDESDALVLDGAGPVYMENNILPPACPVEGTAGAMLAAPAVTVMDPETALRTVLAEAGAHPRDIDDADYTNEVGSSPVENMSWGAIKALYR